MRRRWERFTYRLMYTRDYRPRRVFGVSLDFIPETTAGLFICSLRGHDTVERLHGERYCRRCWRSQR